MSKKLSSTLASCLWYVSISAVSLVKMVTGMGCVGKVVLGCVVFVRLGDVVGSVVCVVVVSGMAVGSCSARAAASVYS